MKRGPKRHDGLDDLLPGGAFVRDCIRSLAVSKQATPSGRDYDFIERHKRGETLEQIGKAYGITRERVRQRLNKCGVKASSGGVAARHLFKRLSARAALLQKRNENSLRIFGVPESVFIEITGLQTIKGAYTHHKNKSHPIITAYINQKRTAGVRGIAWEFTLGTWWAVWLESGKWAERGRGHGYCMARWGDSGPYSPENVYICTSAQNSADSYIVKPALERTLKRAQTMAFKAAA